MGRFISPFQLAVMVGIVWVLVEQASACRGPGMRPKSETPMITE
jgi:hypothetical protein